MNYTFYEGDNVTITAEFIDYLENLKKENQQLKRNCNIGNENLDFYKKEYKKIKPVLDEIRDVLNNQMDYREFVDVVNAIEEILEKVKE